MWKTATLGVGVTLNHSCCYGYQSADVSIFLKLVVYLKAKFGVSTVNIKCMSILQTFRQSRNESKFQPNSSILRSLYCIFNCSAMLLWSTVIQITQIQLSTNTHFWVINWKPHIEIFPERPPCIYAIWLTEVKSYNSRTAITHFLTPGTHT